MNKKNAFIDKMVKIEKGATVGENCTILSYDQSKQMHLETILKSNSHIGAASVIYPGVEVGRQAVVQPGSVVTRTVPPLAIVQGNPARIVGYASTIVSDLISLEEKRFVNQPHVSVVKNVVMRYLPLVSDLRGDLSVGEFEKEIPFLMKRYFLVFGVPTAETRGEHAHHNCEQYLICVNGQCKVIADDGINREEFLLDKPNKGLYLPPMTWGIQYQYSRDAVLLVFASDYYDPDDYIRDYDSFRNLANNGNKE